MPAESHQNVTFGDILAKASYINRRRRILANKNNQNANKGALLVLSITQQPFYTLILMLRGETPGIKLPRSRGDGIYIKYIEFKLVSSEI